MRRHVSAFIECGGGNVAFFSGNTCWWRVHLRDENKTLFCDKGLAAGSNLKRDQWFRIDPENRLTGVSHRHGGGHWWGTREAIGYTVQNAEHWIFAGTGLRDGDVFGADHALVGYECDGTAISEQCDELGFALPRHDDGTPHNFMIAGSAKLGPEWAQDPDGFPGGRTATMGIYRSNGSVFTAGTTDWARVLARGDPHVVKITENILRHLSTPVKEQGAVKHMWKRVFPNAEEPTFIETLQTPWPRTMLSCGKSWVYRIGSVGPNHKPVIAKRCAARNAQVEHGIYKEILPMLAISRLDFYGRIDEPGSEYCWLFLEDAAGEEFTSAKPAHREIAAHWLGHLHLSAARLPAVSRLPDRGPTHYVQHLQIIRKAIRGDFDRSALKSSDFQLLGDVLRQLDFLETRWNRLVELYYRFPRTLVHCDFVTKNLRVRSTASGLSLVAFDWEIAGYGAPAPDLAELTGRGAPRERRDSDLPDTELVKYWAVLREGWPDLSFDAIKQLAEVGAVFRALAAMSWESESICRGWWPVQELQNYAVDLAIAMEHLPLR